LLNITNSETAKVVAIDEQRKKYLKLLHNDRCPCADIIEQGNLYINLLVSYAEFTKNLN